MTEKRVSLELSKDEALVLFDFISKFNQNCKEDIFDDQAEERVLWNLEALLEKKLSEIFNSNYKKILAKARLNVRNI